ncbi:MAG: LPS export ABC transporter permease LptF [Chelatococcus sp.]|jgi:lipopolysaccharide export system permease protein|uniref:LPS export ABC transporter permease LptF n=1 Tax=unclassified Chelatococcus TaxID=2638111 RepID=UPI001BCABCF1|nr:MULTISPECIES: LPS export ABC transporter permease LptF [unclassified Chelatococcus]CAH1673782.1 Lipopolysaccharide export system permease protein LptF [Hyphomicrobiales bacterium]MBS7738781.1 LPS export ABC transporter permease LptF [Chelatococcus sp. HY11]MBX3539880.1 LPS export ABC transporter permease LptF [Chelatococcus sp.]MBX3543185.1 LPS export ABC transporter permease LptF [Chelatococcus sp.]MCO5076688.1 LPS export ABC transporter permease LptF [Chelatococcus sp.]
MGLIDRYILRNVVGAFLACLSALTLVIWITQILKELDLVTGKGQTIGIFLVVTLLSLPALITIIAPAALFIATLYALNRLNGDSELIVMSAAGIPPSRLLRPFATFTVVVTLAVGVMTVYLMPQSFNSLRDLVTKIRADFVANIVKEGQFTTLDTGITFHYREKSGDALLGIFLQDQRDRNKVVVYIAERGQAVDVKGQSYLLLETGSVQRQEPGSKDSAIVTFERYAIDLSVFAQEGADVIYKPRERSTWALMSPDANEPYFKLQEGRFRAELHDRFSAPLYCIAFMLIAFAALGEARTTRQGRGAAILAAIVGVLLVRVAGFAASSAAVRSPAALLGVYGAPLAGCLISLVFIFYGHRLGRLMSALFRKRDTRSIGSVATAGSA